jgi:dihydroxy-acid dehydratase
MTRAAFENAIVVCTAIGGSTNCPPHINAIARHMGVPLDIKDWETIGYDVPLLANIQPAGEYLGESYHRGGGVPAIAGELIRGGKLRTGALTVSGKTAGEVYGACKTKDENFIRPFERPLMDKAGFLVMSGNLFSSALLKTSVISPEFRRKFLSTPGSENAFVSRVIVFDGPEDYRARINDPALAIDDSCMLVIRGCGPVGFPGAAEVVNMTPPDYLARQGVRMLPCMGDGRQSGTSDSPSILNASPESAAGGGLAILQTGDQVKVDLNARRVDLLAGQDEIDRRRAALPPVELKNASPWQELFRAHVGQLETGMCLEFAVKYHDVKEDIPRHSH